MYIFFCKTFFCNIFSVFYISWTKMSDNDDELPCFKLIFDFDNVRKTSSSIRLSESMSEFQSNTKGNNNKSLKTMPVCIVPLEESYIEDFAKRQKAFNTARN